MILSPDRHSETFKLWVERWVILNVSYFLNRERERESCCLVESKEARESKLCWGIYRAHKRTGHFCWSSLRSKYKFLMSCVLHHLFSCFRSKQKQTLCEPKIALQYLSKRLICSLFSLQYHDQLGCAGGTSNPVHRDGLLTLLVAHAMWEEQH